MRVGFFLNLGGTIIGHAPVLLGVGGAAPPGPAPSWLRIDQLALETPPASPAPSLKTVTPEAAVVLSWTASSGMNFEVEVSGDLTHWSVAPVKIWEDAPGLYRARVVGLSGSQRYFRLRVSSSP